MPPTEPREQTADQQIQHALGRLGFGARPGDVAQVRALGVDQWMAWQLAPDRIDDRAAEVSLASYEERRVPTGELVALHLEGQEASTACSDTPSRTATRSEFSEVAARGLGATRLDAVFPGFTGGQQTWLGVL